MTVNIDKFRKPNYVPQVRSANVPQADDPPRFPGTATQLPASPIEMGTAKERSGVGQAVASSNRCSLVFIQGNMFGKRHQLAQRARHHLFITLLINASSRFIVAWQPASCILASSLLCGIVSIIVRMIR